MSLEWAPDSKGPLWAAWWILPGVRVAPLVREGSDGLLWARCAISFCSSEQWRTCSCFCYPNICLLASSLCLHSSNIWPCVLPWPLLLPVNRPLFIWGLRAWEFDTRDNDGERHVFLPAHQRSELIKILFMFDRWLWGRLWVTDYLSFHNTRPPQ